MQQYPILSITRQSAGAIASQRFVGLDDAQCAAGAVAWGIADFEASGAGKAVNVKVHGTSKLQVGAPLTTGQLVQSDAQGRGIPKAAGATLARVIVGCATVDGFAEVLLLPSAA